MGATALTAGRRAFFALFDGHGGDECAEWAARELPAVVTRRLRGVRESAAIKAALKASFEECDAALLRECAAHGWEGRCHVAALLLDQHCTPTRAYVASCGTLQSFACCKEGAFGALKTVQVGKARQGRALGDAKAKRNGGGSPMVPTPEVTSFEVQPAQRFVVMGSAGAWLSGHTGADAVARLSAALPQMDARRAEIEATLASDVALANVSGEKASAMVNEGKQRAHEAGALGAAVQLVSAAQAKKGGQHAFGLMLVRLLQPKEKAVPSVLRAAAQARDAADAANSAAPATEAVVTQSSPAEAVAPAAAPAPVSASSETVEADSGVNPDPEEVDEEERAALAQRERRRQEELAREAQEKAAVVDYF